MVIDNREQTHENNSWRNGFEFANPQAEDKIAELIHRGHQSLAFILDWDGVVTSKDQDGMAGTSWAILKRHMTPENQQKHSALYAHYRPYEKSGSLTAESAESWQRQAMDLLVGSPIDDIEADARRHVKLRHGMPGLFKTCSDSNIPIFINSTGESHVIQAVASQHNIRPTHVFANIFTTEDGKITGSHEHTLTHGLNKHTHSHLMLDGHQDRNTTILIGDNLHDVHMLAIDNTANTIRIRVDGGQEEFVKRHGEDGWQTYLEESFRAGYDMVVIEEDIQPVINLTNAFIDQSVR